MHGGRGSKWVWYRIGVAKVGRAESGCGLEWVLYSVGMVKCGCGTEWAWIRVGIFQSVCG